MSYKEKFESWISDKYFEEFWDELKGLQRDETEVQDCFYKDLDFGMGAPWIIDAEIATSLML